ncbi:Alpha/Beta hydrolase protein [Hyaloraphidium curvatum]|nr:Alpha/Beta hydrolase protein [Hyaloraphidium curvatum]
MNGHHVSSRHHQISKHSATMEGEEKTYVTDDDVVVFYRLWRARGEQRAVAFFLHGFGEHTGRYPHVFGRFAENGISTIAPDHRGHGRTQELNKDMVKGHIESDAMLASYLKLLHRVERALIGDTPVVVFGHSMGAQLAFRFTQLYASAVPNYAGTAGSAPFLGFYTNPVTLQLVRTIGYFRPTFTADSGLAPQHISNDPESVRQYMTDPLVHSTLAAQTLRDWVANIQAILGGAAKFRFPLLITAQPSDQIVPLAPIREFYERAGSRHKKMVILGPEYKHEAHNDVGREVVLQEWVRFILERAAAGPWPGDVPASL